MRFRRIGWLGVIAAACSGEARDPEPGNALGGMGNSGGIAQGGALAGDAGREGGAGSSSAGAHDAGAAGTGTDSSGGWSSGGGAAGSPGGAAGSATTGGGGASAGAAGDTGEACPVSGELLCWGRCLDVSADRANCGACGRTCAATFGCVDGQCACEDGETECSGRCVDTLSDVIHCGDCVTACGPTEICSAGQCVCPKGEAACTQGCTDVSQDFKNCGACGKQCNITQACSGGKCVASAGGEKGPDGCVGLAQNVTLNQISVLQAVEIPIMKAGAAVAPASRNTEVLVGRDTLFRIYITVPSGYGYRNLSARVFVENGTEADVYFTKKSVSYSSTTSSPDSTFQVAVPKDKIRAGTRYIAEIVECGGMAGPILSPRFPATAPTTLNARATSGLKVRVIPLRANGLVPDTTAGALQTYETAALAMYPISRIDFSVGATLDVADPYDWTAMLDAVRARRQSDAPANDVYYYGMLRPAASASAYCTAGAGGGGGTGGAGSTSCTTGMGFYVKDGTASEQAPIRAAVGLAYANQGSANTMLHEIGHNHGRLHAPCGGPAGPDTAYPYLGAQIGVLGWDSRPPTYLYSASYSYDIMSYCGPAWISDYTYDALLTRLDFVNGVMASELPPAEPPQPWRVLLLDQRGPRWGIPIREAVPPVGTAETAQVFDRSGRALESIRVYRTAAGELNAFSIRVPEPKTNWFSVQVAGSQPLVFAP